MTGHDVVDLAMGYENPGKPVLAAGQVITAPAAVGDQLTVQLFGWPADQPYEVPGSHWMPRANPALDSAGGAGVPLIPHAGDRCLVVFDHLGDGWVAVWGAA